MIKPILWDRKYTWSEWRIKHRNSVLTESDAQQLYKTEHQMYDLYEQELIQLRERRVTDYIQDLSLQQSTIQHAINYGGVLGPEALGRYTLNIKTYNTPGTFSVTTPTTPRGYIPYNQVTIEAVGGGGQGQIGSRVYSSGQISYYVGGGGGGGAYAKRSVSISPTITISVTVGGGSTSSNNDGGDSSFTISGTTTTAGGGGTSSRNLGNYPIFGSSPIPVSVLTEGAGGTVTGPSDIFTNGSAGTGGNGQANISDITDWPIGSGYASISDRGRGGASGWPTSTYVNPALYDFKSSGTVTDGVVAQSGNTPGGGGGGGIVTGGGLPNGTQGNGADGRVVVTFGYS